MPKQELSTSSASQKDWIRGVNLGGWLVIERYVVPYQFALTNCHVRGDLCWYPGQLSAPSKHSKDYKLCDLYQCHPLLDVPITGGAPDYPLDEYTLSEAFLKANMGVDDDDTLYRNPTGIEIAERWFNSHFDNFIVEEDIQILAQSGITHIRVPLPHWVMGDVMSNEPWIVGNRWDSFLRLCEWAQKYNLNVWPDIHTAPGSQNGFDNSGHALAAVTCQGWSSSPANVERSLQVIRDVCHGIVKAGYSNVVNGFGLLNEPFKDCNRTVYEEFLDTAKDTVRTILQNEDTSIYVSDMFLAETFNNGHWWLNNPNTYLDSHYYHVFAEQPRDLSPRQHIAYTCQRQWRDAVSCCYDDAVHPKYMFWKKTNTKPSTTGVQRIVGEWSAAYDTLPVAKLLQLMEGIAQTGIAPEYDRTFTVEEKDFLLHFVMAQMVAYESVETGTSVGWFYWTAKMEGGAFAEWDYIRGVHEGWIPILAKPNKPSEDLYGTCYDIMFQIPDDTIDVIHTFPDPKTLPANNWQGVVIDDDVVVSHGQSLMKRDGINHKQRNEVHEKHDQRFAPTQWMSEHILVTSFIVCAILSILITLLRRFIRRRQKQAKYTPIGSTIEV
jgi:glucan 1,3-beta-glucosidase